jgi:hypothetical protein
MNDYLLIAENKAKDIRLLVEDAGPELGYYLYVMRISTGEIYKDHLCDNMEIIFRKAEKEYDINSNDFKPPKEN